MRTRPELDDCHFLPQAAYLAPNWLSIRSFLRRTPPLRSLSATSASAEGDTSGCNVVLRYETLAAEFPLLMRWAGLEAIRLNQPPAAKRANASCFSRAAVLAMLDDDAKALVQELFLEDYDELGYPRDGPALWEWEDQER